MATDMVAHFDLVGKFKTKLYGNGNGLNLENRIDKKLTLNMAIKCADVNNPTKPLSFNKFYNLITSDTLSGSVDVKSAEFINLKVLLCLKNNVEVLFGIVNLFFVYFLKIGPSFIFI